MAQQTFQPCCLSLFTWDGKPSGTESTLPISSANKVYVTGTSTSTAILYIHDAAGWTFPNARILADHFAREVDATVYIPDFFGGEELDRETLLAGHFEDLDMPGFLSRNGREQREPEIFAAARHLKSKYAKVGAVGYCFGGWATFRLAALDGVIDAGVIGHPTFLTKQDIDGAVDNPSPVPMKVLAPEHDEMFTPEMKRYCFDKMVFGDGGKKARFEYRHFPGVAHACFTKGDEKVPGEREAMAKGKGAAVAWFREWLVES